MKAVLHYRSSPGFRDLLARRTPDWLDIVVVEEADTGTFAAAMGDTEVLFHVLQPVTAAIIRAVPAADSKDRGWREYHRPGGRPTAWDRGGQYAGDQYAGGG